MVTVGPDTQSYNFTHMVSFSDYNSQKQPQLCIIKNSIYDFLRSTKGFSKFLKIVELADRGVRANEITTNVTMFIPHDDFLQNIPNDFFTNMDEGLARQILASSTLRNRIDKNLVTSSPVSYLTTLNPRMRLYVTNISGKTEINNCLQVVKFNQQLVNGLVHITTGLIIPTEDTFMN